mgnify:CR=1 FL=1
MEFFEILKELRELKGLKQNEVAKSINISAVAYNKLEKNSRKPDILLPCTLIIFRYQSQLPIQERVGELGVKTQIIIAQIHPSSTSNRQAYPISSKAH